MSVSTVDELDPSLLVNVDLRGPNIREQIPSLVVDWATRQPFYVDFDPHVLVICSRYEDVRTLYRDVDNFSNAVPREPGYEMFDKFMGVRVLAQMDGEAHARVRRLMTPAFSPTAVREMEADMLTAVDRLLDRIEDSGDVVDLMGVFGRRLIVEVLLREMLNLTPEQVEIFLEMHRVTPLVTYTSSGEDYPEECVRAFDAARDMIQSVIDERRSDPGNDVISRLVTARDGTDRLDDVELFDQTFTVCAGALSGTTGAMGAVLWGLFSHPEAMRHVRDDPSLTSGAIDECLRLHLGYLTFPRFAVRDVEIGGTPIKEGMVVRACPAAAHRDPTVFEDPLSFDIHRQPKTITFGGGPHLCLGNRLAKAAMRVAVDRMLERFPEIRLADADFVPSYEGSVGEMRLETLPVTKS